MSGILWFLRFWDMLSMHIWRSGRVATSVGFPGMSHSHHPWIPCRRWPRTVEMSQTQETRSFHGKGGAGCLVAFDLYLKPTADTQGLRFCLEDGLEKMVCFGNWSVLWQNHLITNTLKAQNLGKQHPLHIHVFFHVFSTYQRSNLTFTAEHAEVSRFSILTNEQKSVQWDFYRIVPTRFIQSPMVQNKPHGPSCSIMVL